MRGRVLGALLALTVALAGCGDDDPAEAGGGPGSTSASPTLSAHERGLKFAQCMREHGVDVPDPEPGKGPMVRITGGPDGQDKMRKAQEACKQYAPPGADGQGNPDPQRLEAMRKYAQCMRDNGVPAFPDPEGAGFRINKDVGDDPDFPAAQQLCSKQFLPEAGQR